jgi:hypothetical protein
MRGVEIGTEGVPRSKGRPWWLTVAPLIAAMGIIGVLDCEVQGVRMTWGDRLYAFTVIVTSQVMIIVLFAALGWLVSKITAHIAPRREAIVLGAAPLSQRVGPERSATEGAEEHPSSVQSSYRLGPLIGVHDVPIRGRLTARNWR